MTTQIVATQPKFVLKSMSIWGAIISVLSMGLQVVGPILEATGNTNPVQPGDVEVVSGAGQQVVSGLGTLIGAALVIIGRFRAGKTAQPISMVVNAAPTTLDVVKPSSTPKASG